MIRKPILWLAALVGLAFLGVALAVAIRAHRLGDALVADVLRLSAEQARPVHRPPAVGTTVNACLGPLLDANSDAGVFSVTAPESVRTAIDDVLDGGLPPSALPASVQEELAAVTPWLDQVLACARAPATGGDTDGLGLFARWNTPRNGSPFYPFAQAKLAGLAIVADVEQGRPGQALARCADALAMLRDAGFERGLIGAMQAASGMVPLTQPCGAAINAADAPALRRFVAEVGVVRSSALSFPEVLELERVQAQMIFFGRELTAGQRGRLTATAQGFALEGPAVVGEEDWYARPMAWLKWPASEERLGRLAKAAAGPDRAKALLAIEQEDSPMEAFLGAERAEGVWERFAKRYDARALGLDLLESAARVLLNEPPLAGVDVVRRDGEVLLAVRWVGEPAALLLRLRDRQPSP